MALGLALGCGLMIRPNNTGVQFTIILTEIALVVRGQRPLREGLREWVAAGMGFVLPLAAVSLYFVSRNAFQAFVEASFLYNLSYAGRPDILGAFLGGLRNLGPVVGIALLGIWLAIERFWGRLKEKALEPMILWLCLDFIVEIVFSGLSGLSYPHYYISWLPWMAFACGLTIARLLPAFNQWAERHPLGTVLGGIAIVSLVSLNTLVGYSQTFVHLAGDRTVVQRQEVLPTYISDHTQPHDTVLPWGGEVGINFLARRDAPTAHFQYGILVPSEITDRISAQFYRDLRLHPPALILDRSLVAGDTSLPPLSTPNPTAWASARHIYAPPNITEFFDFVHQNYTYKTTVAGVLIYHLNP